MIRGLIFDLNGTLIDILTNEGDDNVYRVLSNLLDYWEISIPPEKIKDFYFEENKRQRRESPEDYPEFDVAVLFQCMLERYAPPHILRRWNFQDCEMAEILAKTFRAASRYQLKLYPGVRETMDLLKGEYAMTAVSDGQSLWAEPELRAVGLRGYFDRVIVSGDLGYRKPDIRIFQAALRHMHLQPQEVLFIGNDMYRDVFGAGQLGIKTVFFKSNQGEQQYKGAKADYIIYQFSQLTEAIRFLS